MMCKVLRPATGTLMGARGIRHVLRDIPCLGQEQYKSEVTIADCSHPAAMWP